jgi:phosphoglycerate dehydrogenase-like enzyme
MMRPEAILVNTSRGPVLDEPALTKALREGWIAGAALDVLEEEPTSPDNPLLELDNVILTPHLASNSDLFPGAIWRDIYKTLIDLANHRWPPSVVNPDVQPRWELA